MRGIRIPQQDFVLKIWGGGRITLHFHCGSLVLCPSPTTAIEIGFTRQRIYQIEDFWQYDTLINKSRESEQTFFLQIQVHTLLSAAGQRATPDEDFETGHTDHHVWYGVMGPSEYNILFSYLIRDDLTPENQEAFQLSVTPEISSPAFSCDINRGCYQQIEIVIIDDDGE